MRTKSLSTCAAILILSGMPVGMTLAQQQTDPRNPSRPGTQQRQPQGQTQDRTQDRTQQVVQRTRDFTRYDELRGSRIHNNAGEAIASVRDLIVDRGTGEIVHVLVRSGSVMGLGGSHVAIPYEMFRWDPAERRLTLNYTKDQIQNMREFDRGDWNNLLEEDASVNHETAYQQLREIRDRQTQQDNFHQSLQNHEAVELTGTVRRIRTDQNAMGRPLTMTVETQEHGMVDVLLAPAWYANGFSGAPMRGEQVTIKGAEINRTQGGMNPSRDDQDRRAPGSDDRDRDTRDRDSRDPGAPRPDARQSDTRLNQAEKTFVARSIRSSRGEINLRGDDWQPLWNTEPRQPGSTQRRSGGTQFVPFRYVLLDDVIGKDTSGRAEECGEVQSAIIDISTGHVAFLGVDADENFLGIGDETYLVPWSIVRVHANGVAIDSLCSQIKSSTPVPEELDDLRDESTWQRLFRNFDIDEPDRGNNSDARRPMAPTRDSDNRPMPRR